MKMHLVMMSCSGLLQTFLLILLWNNKEVKAYYRIPCTRAVRLQIQLPDCYIPPMDKSIPLSKASFLMSHDAATGYLSELSPRKPINQAVATYAKNQIGSIYDQLNYGARALDLRPKLLMNGTIIFSHGLVDMPVSMEVVLNDVIRWCSENPDELVLLLPSNLQYEYSTYNDGGSSYVSAMTSVLDQFGIPYVHCNDVYEYTVGETMNIAALPTGGYALTMDQQDYYGSFCGKSNWIEDLIVTCYSYPEKLQPNNEKKYINNNNDRIKNVQCTKSRNRSSQLFESLKKYVLASANNQPTDDSQSLGPPSNTYDQPFNEIQALWQVDDHAVLSGLKHFSSLLEDNRRSRLNAKLVQWIYDGELDLSTTSGISLLAVDNVALHGNALLSVIRNRCGQSTNVDLCGKDIDLPRLFHISLAEIIYWTVCSFLILLTGAMLWHNYLKNRRKIENDLDFIYSDYVCA